MTPVSPEDQQLYDAFDTLAPAPDRLASMEDRILANHALNQKSLAAEWLDLFRVGPVLQAGYAVAAAAGLAVITPVGTLLLAATLL